MAGRLSEERFRAAEERALREIDRERTLAAKLQKDLDQVRTGATLAADRHRAEISGLHNEAGHLKQTVGSLEGKLQAAQSERDRVFSDAESLRQMLSEATAQAAGYRAEAEGWRRRTDELQQTVVQLQAKRAQRSRKSANAEKAAKLL